MKLVVPNQGAAVTAQFSARVGQRVLLALTDRNGKPLPFGAMASSESQQQQSIVDEGGVLYLTGVNEQPQTWSVRWGNEENQQCRFTFSLPANSQRAASVIRATTPCR